MARCLFCDRGLEPKHYICDLCGNGMCDLCYEEEMDHNYHIVQNPAEVCENLTISKILSIKLPGYGCYSCINKIKRRVK